MACDGATLLLPRTLPLVNTPNGLVGDAFLLAPACVVAVDVEFHFNFYGALLSSFAQN